MILNNNPQNQAILSNVGQVGEFRIRNSAKAFNILSSGLYANKIRAIIRELSCNAVDSHMAAGKSDIPFDVHLPNAIEPWFSIRDYGTGLTHDQVTNIYTTYFESTKTNSNDFIGALGLGSKSPFSYTDNFSVIAIRDGRRGIYTAFINEHGVPSIALMMEEETTEPNGVEVKFAVTERWDFDKFRNEAQIVYVYFKMRPVVHGYKDFKLQDPTYKDKNIIPGVHYTGKENRSIAVMGNIAYPIDVPQADVSLGNLCNLLDCGLVMEFDIGELDFQASREGLSYIPSTVDAIKRKLTALNTQLAIHVATEADKIDNLWQRADYLVKRHNEGLFKAATVKYIQDTKFPLGNPSNKFSIIKPFSLKVSELASKYNITLRGFYKDRSSDKCSNLKSVSIMDDVTKQHVQAWSIQPSMNIHFVITDTKRGALERAKFHWRNRKMNSFSEHVIVIEAADKTKTINVGSFLRELHNPPNTMYATQLMERDQSSKGNWGKASILRFEERQRSRHTTKYVWTNAGTASNYDPNKIYYYVEMNHWDPVGVPMRTMEYFQDCLQRAGIFTGDIYGVRKNDIELVRKQKNWVELTAFVRQQLLATDTSNVLGLVKAAIDFNSNFKYINDNLKKDSPYYKLYAELKDVELVDGHKMHHLEQLFKAFGIVINAADPQAMIQQYKIRIQNLKDRYPMLKHLSSYSSSVTVSDVVNYINMVDQVKGYE
jgi:hypothetical protein